MLFLFYAEVYHIVVILKFFFKKLISHTGKVMLKILQDRLQQYMNWEIPDVKFKLDLEKAEEPEVRLPTSAGSPKKAKEFQKNFWLCGSPHTEENS